MCVCVCVYVDTYIKIYYFYIRNTRCTLTSWKEEEGSKEHEGSRGVEDYYAEKHEKTHE